MNFLVNLLPVTILMTMEKEQENTQSKLSIMKIVITEERCIDMH